MSLNSSRLLLARSIVAFLATVQNGSNPLYAYTKLGAVFDPSPYASWAEVTLQSARSGPAGSGGSLVGWRIEDNPIFKITSGWPYEADSTAAMTNMLTAMDILVPTLHSHYQLPSADNPAQPVASLYSLLEDQVERAMPVRFPNGHVYLLWETFCTTKTQYNVSLVNP